MTVLTMANQQQQQQITNETDIRASSHLWFTGEIQRMMHGFGDCSKPLFESASLIEDIVFRQIVQILYQVEVIAHKRNGRYIGIEDFLFLFRSNKRKLHRLLKFLDFKDLKAAAIKAINLDEDDNGESDAKQSHKKRRKVCQDFLSCIDQTGELIALLDEDEEDEVKKERRIRAEVQTRNMNVQQYLEFCESRQASFTPRYKIQKFKDWILSGVNLDIKPNTFALEILSYLAYETTAEIVDLALIVKRDINVSPDDPFGREMAPVSANYEQDGMSLKTDQTDQSSSQMMTTPNAATDLTIGPQLTSFGAISNKSKKRKFASQQMNDLITSQAITPSDIQEVSRRFLQPIGPFADFSMQPLLSISKRHFCC